MNPVSIIILLLIIAYCAFVIYKQVQKKKQGGCGGNCAGCSGSVSYTHLDVYKRQDIKCGLIYSGNGKCLWLLYREQQVNQYLMDPENQRFLKHCGYSSFQIQNILYTLKNRYRLYKAGQADFPHELGLILGYPLCDVIGFIKNNGQNCLYCRCV